MVQQDAGVRKILTPAFYAVAVLTRDVTCGIMAVENGGSSPVHAICAGTFRRIQ